MKTLLLPAFSMGLCLMASCGEAEKKEVKRVVVGFTREGELAVYRQGTDSLLTRLDIEIADSEYETQTGLMYRESMEDRQGMLFIFPEERMHSFYMKNTKFPLDILFVKEDLSIASIRANAQPLDESSLSSRVPVRYVLEVNAGLVGKEGIQVGDSISFERMEE